MEDHAQLNYQSAETTPWRLVDRGWLGALGVLLALAAVTAAAYLLWPRGPSNVPGEAHMMEQLVALLVWGLGTISALVTGCIALVRARGGRRAWGVAAILLALSPFAVVLVAIILA